MSTVDVLERDIAEVDRKIETLAKRNAEEKACVEERRKNSPQGPYLPKVPDAAVAVTDGFAQDDLGDTVEDLEVRRKELVARRDAAMAAIESKEEVATTGG